MTHRKKRKRELLLALDKYLSKQFRLLHPMDPAIKSTEHYLYCMAEAAIAGDSWYLKYYPQEAHAYTSKLALRIRRYYYLSMDLSL